MKKNSLLVLFFALIIEYSHGQPATNTDSLAGRQFTPAQLKEDFTYLRKILEETHPGLYRYTSKTVLQDKLDSISRVLDKPMEFYDYYSLLSGLIAAVRCSHTYIIPQQEIEPYMVSIRSIPFELSPSAGKIYVILNGTADEAIKPGAELISVNGKPAAEILDLMYSHIWVDGFITTAKVSQASGIRFALFYYLFVERPDSFRLVFNTTDGKTVETTVAAQPYTEYSKWYLKNPVNKPVMDIYMPRNKADRDQPWRLEFPSQSNTAFIILRSFGGGNSSEVAAKKMRDFMEKCLATIKKKNIGNLIIDLRSNKGGWDSQGVELMKYLIKQSAPFRYFGDAHTITADPEYLKLSDLSRQDLADIKKELIPTADGKFRLDERYNSERQEQLPATNRFTGNVYFLINGVTASAAAEFAAVAKSNHTGVFIGAETGGAYEGSNGGSFLHFTLPNTLFYAGTPLIYSANAVQPPMEKGRGTIPDHKIASTMEDILSGRDSQLEFVLQLIREAGK